MTRNVRIVLLCGPAQAGKSTVANELCYEYGFERWRFAHTLKAMLITMGLDREAVDGTKKEARQPLLGGKTGRFAMVSLALWARTNFGRTIFSEILASQLKTYLESLPDGARIVVDDMRYMHELRTMREHFGDQIEVWRVTKSTHRDTLAMKLARRGWGRMLLKALRIPQSEGESWWPALPVDLDIKNDGTMADLHVHIVGIMGEQSEPRRIRLK